MLNTYCSLLCHCMAQTAMETLPLVNNSATGTPGWNDSARHLRDKTGFWHKVWHEVGSP